MELIEFVQGHLVEQRLGLVDGEEVADGVKHKAAPMEIGTILDAYGRYAPRHALNVRRSLNLVGEQLAQGGYAIDNAAIAVGGNEYARFVADEFIVLVVGVGG